jgi:hypothetical protein
MTAVSHSAPKRKPLACSDLVDHVSELVRVSGTAGEGGCTSPQAQHARRALRTAAAERVARLTAVYELPGAYAESFGDLGDLRHPTIVSSLRPRISNGLYRVATVDSPL